ASRPLLMFAIGAAACAGLGAMALFLAFVFGGSIFNESLKASMDNAKMNRENLEILRRSVELYRKQNGANPSSLAELVETQFVDRIPPIQVASHGESAEALVFRDASICAKDGAIDERALHD